MFDGWSNAMFCKKRAIFLMQQICQYYIVIKRGFDYMCYDWFFELCRQVGHVNTTHSVKRFMSYILQTIFCNFETTHVSDIYLNIVYLKVSQPLITNVTLPLLRAYGVISFLLIFFFPFNFSFKVYALVTASLFRGGVRTLRLVLYN